MVGLPDEAPTGAKSGTPGSKYAGGHRIRVPPVPIPNTEVKPDTADGTVWETAWESRSLPALFRKKSPGRISSRAFLFSSAITSEAGVHLADVNGCGESPGDRFESS